MWCGTDVSPPLGDMPPPSTDTSPRLPSRPHSQSSPLPHGRKKGQRSLRRGSEPSPRTAPSCSGPSTTAPTPRASDHNIDVPLEPSLSTQQSLPRGPRPLQRPGIYPLQNRRPLTSVPTARLPLSPSRRLPYPLTPPLTPQPVHLSRHGSSFPTPGFRAPSPHQHRITTPNHNTRPQRPPLTWKHCLSRLDNALKKLSTVASFWLVSFVISLCIFIRSLTSDIPHLPVSKTALLIWFCVSAAGLSIFFSLVLGVLCRRARRTPLSHPEAARTRGDDIEMQNFVELVTNRFAMNVRSRDIWARRNAMSGPSDGRAHQTRFDGRNARTRRSMPVQTEERVIRRPDALPVRVSSAPLLSGLFNPTLVPPPPPGKSSRRDPLLSPRLSPLVPPKVGKNRDHPPPVVINTPFFPEQDTSADVVRSTAYFPLTHSDIGSSPRTKTKPRPDTPRPSTISHLSSHVFDRHMQTAGTRELQAYLQSPLLYPSKRNSNKHSIRKSLGVYHDVTDADAQSLESDNESNKDHRVRTASIMSLRSAGKAKECFVRGSPGANTVLSPGGARVIDSGPRTPNHDRGEASRSPNDLPQTGVQVLPRKILPLAPKPQAVNKNISSQVRRSVHETAHPQKLHPSSPKKESMTRRNDRSKPVGLGISVAEEDKENMNPESVRRSSGESDEVDAWIPVLPFESA